MRTRFLLFSGVLFALGATAACGGSGSSGPAAGPTGSNALLAGAYHYLTVGGEQGPPAHTLVQWGASQADGAGTLDVTALAEDVDDTVGAGSPFSTPYSVAPDFGFTLGGAGLEVAHGGITADGRLALTASTRPGTMPALLMLVRQGSGFSAADVAGTWHFLYHSPFTTTGQILWGTVTLDGLGGQTLDLQSMVNGVPNGSIVQSDSYSVAPDGTLSMTAPKLVGGLLPSGDVAILVGPQSTPLVSNTAAVCVILRESTAATVGTLSGTYTVVGRRVDVPAGTQNAVTGTATVTSPGTLAVSWVENHEGTIGSAQNATLTFTIGPDGRLVLLADDIYVGAVSQDGRVAAVVGGTEYGSDAQILVLSR